MPPSEFRERISSFVYHEVMGSRHRRSARSPAGSALLLAALLATAGCAYTCHVYPRFAEPVPGTAWTIKGTVDRYHHEDWKQGPGSWPHWKARDDDRYRLELAPVHADTTWWREGRIDLVEVVVRAGADTIPVVWAEKSDLYLLHRHRIDFRGRPWPHELKYGRYGFVSEFFPLARPVPDTLVVEGILLEIDRKSRAVRARQPFRAEAIVDKHRRWHIADMIES
jgi:hypothetical protein